MRRHRALALSIIAAVTMTACGIVVFVRNIAAQRDRADGALVSAQQERDRAKLSEAALVLDRDPNRAAGLLAPFSVRTPQVSMLLSRARQRSATQIIKTVATIGRIFRARDGVAVEIWKVDGELERVDPRTGARTVLARDVAAAFTYRGSQGLYLHRPASAVGLRVEQPSSHAVLEIESLDRTGQLVALSDTTLLLDAAGALHQLDGRTARIIDRHVQGIAGDGDVLLVCRRDGALDVEEHGVIVQRKRCARVTSTGAMAVVGQDYAVVDDDGSLIMRRDGRTLELPAGIAGEYELALSDHGVVGIADYSSSGKTWFVRPGGSKLEAGPVHESPPFSVAADGNLVAWGYLDGTAIVCDTVSGMVWEFHGHADSVQWMVIDAANARLVTVSQRELRVWDVNQAATTFATALRCSVYHIEPSPDATQLALDCDDGAVRLWSRQSRQLVQIDKHADYAFGVAWVRGMICSGGWGKGHVQCMALDHTSRADLDSGSGKINSMTTTPDHRSLIMAASDGGVWQFDGAFRKLYASGVNAHGTAVSGDGALLGSCARDGSITAFDLINNRLLGTRFGHVGAYCDVSWVGHELWSSGDEGTLKRWDVAGGDLKLTHMVQVSDSLRMLKVLGSGWTAVEGGSTLLVSRDGGSVALRVDAGKAITALEVSADRRYIAASMNGEILVVDLLHDSVATLATGTPIQQVRFLEPALLAFSEPMALKTLRVDQLDYVPFVPAPEPANRASF